MKATFASVMLAVMAGCQEPTKPTQAEAEPVHIRESVPPVMDSYETGRFVIVQCSRERGAEASPIVVRLDTVSGRTWTLDDVEVEFNGQIHNTTTWRRVKEYDEVIDQEFRLKTELAKQNGITSPSTPASPPSLPR